MRQGGPDRSVGDPDQSLEGGIHLQDQEDRT